MTCWMHLNSTRLELWLFGDVFSSYMSLFTRLLSSFPKLPELLSWIACWMIAISLQFAFTPVWSKKSVLRDTNASRFLLCLYIKVPVLKVMLNRRISRSAFSSPRTFLAEALISRESISLSITTSPTLRTSTSTALAEPAALERRASLFRSSPARRMKSSYRRCKNGSLSRFQSYRIRSTWILTVRRRSPLCSLRYINCFFCRRSVKSCKCQFDVSGLVKFYCFCSVACS
jgi:hypothetical protein